MSLGGGEEQAGALVGHEGLVAGCAGLGERSAVEQEPRQVPGLERQSPACAGSTAKSLLPRVARWALAAALLAVAGPAHAAGEFKARGFTLPTGSVKVDEDRYRMPLAWEEMQRYLRNTYPPAKYPRRALPNQNGVRAVHIVNPRTGDEWEGANVYEAGKGEVRVYLLAGKGEPAEAPPTPAGKGSKGK